MERYKLIKEVGDGTFGTVWRAINKQSSEVVAIKKMKKKYYSWEECVNLREVKSLRRLNHTNIVKLKEVIRESDILYFVFEYMDCNLYQLMKERSKPFSEVEVRNWCFQIFQALAYMHQRGYFHRDLKPENLLVAKDIIKVADFGLAREISSKLPFTEYVSTRWYRAPEVLLQSYVYGSAVDMWAMGAIIAELLTLHPLFPGSSEVDELHKICNVIGTPSRHSWAEGLLLADAIKFQFPQVDNVPLSVVIPSASEEAISLITSLCAWDPSKRPTAAETLQHPFFQPCFYIPPSFRMRTSIGVANTPPSAGTRDALEQKTARRYSMGVVSNVKPASNFSAAKVNAAFKTGVNRKLEMDNREAEKSEKFMKNDTRIPRYQPPMKQKAGALGRDAQRVSDVAEKLAHFTLNPSRSPNMAQGLVHPKVSLVRQTLKQSPNMKAGGWRNHTNFMGRQGAIPSARSYSPRKVAG